MSLNNVTPVNSYTANGITTVFAYAFRILAASHLVVKLDGVVQSAGFTVSGVNSPSGGSVTFTVAPTSLVVVNLSRVTPADQQATYLLFEQNDLSASQALETALDKLTMIEQEQALVVNPFYFRLSVSPGAETLDITHALNSLSAALVSVVANWNTQV